MIERHGSGPRHDIVSARDVAGSVESPAISSSELGDIKAIICDVDGTLLTSEYVCSPVTAAAIAEVRERGYLFGLCTCRDAIGTRGQLADWGLDGLVDVIVGSGGAEVLDVGSGAYELSHPLPGDAIKEIMAHYENMDVSFVIPYRGVLYTPVDHPRMELISKADGLPYEVVDFEQFLAEPKPKVMLFCMPEYMERVIERSKTFASDRCRFAALVTSARLYEYMDPRVTKPAGLERAAELYGFGIDEVLAFGDADNDAAMLAAAGVGVAMGNGSERTRAAADYVVADNDHDGIANFLREHIIGV